MCIILRVLVWLHDEINCPDLKGYMEWQKFFRASG
jgi:hypothetical protein